MSKGKKALMDIAIVSAILGNSYWYRASSLIDKINNQGE